MCDTKKHSACCCAQTTTYIAELERKLSETSTLASQRLAKILHLERAALTRWRDCAIDPPPYGTAQLFTTPNGIRPGHRLHTDIAGDWYNIVMPCSGGYKRTQEVSLWYDMQGCG